MIRHLISSGGHVIVATVFAEGGPEHASRREEDLAAAALLGFTPLHLGFSDAPFRKPGYHGFREILFGWNDQDAVTIQAVTAKLQDLRSACRPARIFAPLAVGTHVDHRIVYQAVAAAGWGEEIEFYEDSPYAYARGSAELRLAQLGVPMPEIDEAQLAEDWRDLPFVRLYLPSGNEAIACERLLLSSTESATGLSAKNSMLACDAEACHQAARCYASQYEAFCGGDAAHAMLDLRHSLHLGGPAARTERYWRLSRSIS